MFKYLFSGGVGAFIGKSIGLAFKGSAIAGTWPLAGVAVLATYAATRPKRQYTPEQQALDHEIVSGVSPAAEVVPVKRAKPVRRKPAAKSAQTAKKRIRKHADKKEAV